MTETSQDPGDVHRLKSILFRNEQKAIDDIRDQLEAHHERIGSDVVMQETVSTVLAGALRDARVRQHKQVADAIAPILVEGMKREIRNSRDEMVDALYPIMGRLVSAYVSSAVADVMNQTNQRLESGLSGRFLYLRGKALLTGQSYNKLAVADRQMFKINELMLIRRGSGVLIDHLDLQLDEKIGGSGEENDNDLVSGVVAAIHDFAQNAFSGKRSALRSVDMGDQTIYLRATSGLILAVIGEGRARRKLERALDAELVTLLEERSSDIEKLEDDKTETAPKILPYVAERLLAVQMDASSGKPILALLLVGLIGASVAGYAGWSGFQSWQTARLHAAVEAEIAQQPAFDGYPVQITVAPDRSRVRLAGFAPSIEARDTLVRGLGETVGSAELKAVLNILPETTNVETRVSTTELKLSALADDALTRPELAALTGEVKRLGADYETQRSKLEERAETLRKRIAALEKILASRTDSPSALAMWTLRNGVFFINGTQYRDRSATDAVLDKLVSLLKADPARLRVVGYADARGNARANSVLAQQRAERVAEDLRARGISADRLIAVGRASERQFTPETGSQSGNRRVEFELLFDGE